MTNVASGKKTLAIAVLACLSAILIAVPAASAFYYAQGGETETVEAMGSMEIVLTVDESANGGSVTTDLIFVPVGCTAADALEEGIISSESQQGIEDIHDYSYTSVADYLSGKTYTVTVYEAGSQEAGTQTTYDTEGTVGEDTPLERYDSVVVTVE